MKKNKPIFIAASPNTEPDDLELAKNLLFNPRRWGDESSIAKLQQDLESYFGNKSRVFLTDSGRSAWYLFLKSLHLAVGSEVIVPAFSCLVVANPVLWNDLRPIYVDIDPQTYNYDLADLAKKISPQTKVVLLQHTFGRSEDWQAIKKILKGKNIIVVEDLAHALGGTWQGKKLGTIGDAALLTFGIEKVISGVRAGGMLINNSSLLADFAQEYAQLATFPRVKTLIALLNPLFWRYVYRIYYWGFGRFTLGRMFTFLGHKFGLLGNMIEDSENQARKPNWLPTKISPELATLVSQQLNKLQKFSKHRSLIANIYIRELDLDPNKYRIEENTFLRFPLLVNQRRELLLNTKKQQIVLGEWYNKVLFAPAAILPKLGYEMGSAPQTEQVVQEIVNLPTMITVDEQAAQTIAKLVKPYLKNGN